MLAHLPLSPDLAPCCSYLFHKPKEKLQEKWFTNAEEAVAAYEKAVEAITKCKWTPRDPRETRRGSTLGVIKNGGPQS
ncbi:hypothetical protein EVAR_12374_1 [Eumeta japonica]|uniref:Uncharacterized protein n=1 Tax=Eumeta variegata TaxID=151549 RepID=A0A4C1TZ29_EUMVA|nr:hypothetical protein EVAR_12374_1 [Eumeta japonica]